ncbi:MAG: DUF302 domain-containing protein [Planctomycetes bacterium]|nr:DUF302 domain-containing protein [Planctomycetota bacterium]
MNQVARRCARSRWNPFPPFAVALSVLPALASCAGTEPLRAAEEETMLITFDSRKPLDRLAKDLEAACAAHKFGVLGVHDLKAKLKEKGQDFAKECRVYEVCNPVAAKRVLDTNLEISTALPCRISLYEAGNGVTRLATIRPTMLLDIFRTPALKEVAKEVEAALIAIMKEAAA